MVQTTVENRIGYAFDKRGVKHFFSSQVYKMLPCTDAEIKFIDPDGKIWKVPYSFDGENIVIGRSRLT